MVGRVTYPLHAPITVGAVLVFSANCQICGSQSMAFRGRHPNACIQRRPLLFGMLALLIAMTFPPQGIRSSQAQSSPPPAQASSPSQSETETESETEPESGAATAAARRDQALIAQMSGHSMIGSFTTIRPGNEPKAKDRELAEDRYDILSIRKAETADDWIIRTRIRYGQFDVTIPVFVEIQWAGETPMIIVDKLAIPGLGTFDARVLIHDDRYAGTWQHDAVGGHLFGRLEPTEEAPAEEAPAEEAPADVQEPADLQP